MFVLGGFEGDLATWGLQALHASSKILKGINTVAIAHLGKIQVPSVPAAWTSVASGGLYRAGYHVCVSRTHFRRRLANAD